MALAESDGGRRSSLLRIPFGRPRLQVDPGATSTDVVQYVGRGDLAHAGEPPDIGDGPRIVPDRAKELLAIRLMKSRVDVLTGVRDRWERASALKPPIMPGLGRFSHKVRSLADEYAAPGFVDNDVERDGAWRAPGGRRQGVTTCSRQDEIGISHRRRRLTGNPVRGGHRHTWRRPDGLQPGSSGGWLRLPAIMRSMERCEGAGSTVLRQLEEWAISQGRRCCGGLR